MFEKHLWKSDILSKDAVFFQHFASKNQLPGLSISGTLVENGLNIARFRVQNQQYFPSFLYFSALFHETLEE